MAVMTVRRKTMKVAGTRPQMRVTARNQMKKMITNSKYPIDPDVMSPQRKIVRKVRTQKDPKPQAKALAGVTALKKETT